MRHPDSSSDIVLAIGEERILSLPSLAMAGYQWSASVSGADPGAVVLELRHGDLAVGSKPGISAPKEAVLRGIRPGLAIVRFVQRRPWERDQPPIQVVEQQVEVRE